MVRQKLISRKYFFVFTSVWDDGKCWQIRNCFSANQKIKTSIVKLVYSFIFCLIQNLSTETPLFDDPHCLPPPLKSPVSTSTTAHHLRSRPPNTCTFFRPRSKRERKGWGLERIEWLSENLMSFVSCFQKSLRK